MHGCCRLRVKATAMRLAVGESGKVLMILFRPILVGVKQTARWAERLTTIRGLADKQVDRLISRHIQGGGKKTSTRVNRSHHVGARGAVPPLRALRFGMNAGRPGPPSVRAHARYSPGRRRSSSLPCKSREKCGSSFGDGVSVARRLAGSVGGSSPKRILALTLGSSERAG
jgi:hypothetical protein